MQQIMKTPKLPLSSIALLALSTLNPQLSTVFAQGTAFTYQGRLNDGGSPATGLYDFRCAIFDAPVNGIGVLLTNTATPVTNGLFTLTLDFGGIFNGAARWLDLSVRTNGPGDFTPLAPRQALTPTPYAMYTASAYNAATANSAGFANSSPASGLIGTLNLSQLPAGVLTNNATGVTLGGTFSGSGVGLSNLNAARLTGTISSNNIAAGTISAAMLVTASNWFTLRMTNPTPVLGDQFGYAVAAVGSDKVLIAANADDTGATDSGAAYLFSSSGALLTTFTNPTPGSVENFGFSVAGVGSDKVLIGAPADSTAGAFAAGAAYLFGTNGALLFSFMNPTPLMSEHFGISVAAVGTDRVLIAAPDDNTGASGAGAAYLFSTSGPLLTTFTNPTPAALDQFGSAVTAVGIDRVLIGACADHTAGIDAGAAYLFSTNGALLTTFSNPTPGSGENFGFSVAAVGSDKVLIGAPDDNTGAARAGGAYLFGTNGALLTTFTNPTPAASDHFGNCVAAVGADRVLIGAEYDGAGASQSGAAYLFSANGALLATFTNPTPAAMDEFGCALAAVGTDRLLIAASGDGMGAPGAGVAYLFSPDTYNPGLIAESVRGGSITSAGLADGAVTAAKIGGELLASQIPDLDASTLTTGTLAEARLSANVALLNANQAFTGPNRFAGVVTLTNPANTLVGSFTGNGGALTNLNAGQITSGSLPLAQLPAVVVTNNETGVTLSGAFSGNGGGLTNLQGTVPWQAVAGASQAAAPDLGYLLTNNAQVTITLPATPALGDVVRVSGGGTGGWKVAQNSGQIILAGNLPGNLGASWTAHGSSLPWSCIASSADGTKLVAGVYSGGGQIYTSTDSGVTWIPRFTMGAWMCLASSADGTKLVGGIYGGQLYTSSNSGTNWTARATSQNWISIASSADGTKLVAAAQFGQLYTSTDSGATWTARASTQQWHGVASSSDGTRLVACAMNSGQIWTSADSGVTWMAHLSAGDWADVASSADGSKLVAANYAGQIYTSTDYGVSWTAHASNQSWWAVASSADGTKLAAVPQNSSQVYTSADSGVTWSAHGSSRAWADLASSADGAKLVGAVSGGQIYTASSSTTLGTSGYLTGGQYGAIELQYIGSGQFIPLSHEGGISAY